MRPLGDEDSLRFQPMLQRLEIVDDERRVGHAGQFERYIQQGVASAGNAHTIEDQVGVQPDQGRQPGVCARVSASPD